MEDVTATSPELADVPDQQALKPSRKEEAPFTPLYLAEDVFLCVTQGHGVFLDLKRDKYSAIIFSSDDATSSAEGAAVSLAGRIAPQSQPLIEAGLLTGDPANGRPIAPVAIPAIEGHIFGLDDQRAFGLTGDAAKDLNIRLGEVLAFFWASWRASRNLKTRHIARIVEDVRKRKTRGANAPCDLENVKRLTAVFRRLRPWYPRRYLCLYDSLALVEFLARENIYPLWVFAVQAQPFGAHCWVQAEGLLLNEGSEYAGQFTPIMAI